MFILQDPIWCKPVSIFTHKVVRPPLEVSIKHYRCFRSPFRPDSHKDGADGRNALTMFLWQNGAAFDSVMNKYTSAPFPAGIDPRTPHILKTFEAFNSSVNTPNDTLPEGVKTSRSASLIPPNVLNNNSGPSDKAAI